MKNRKTKFHIFAMRFLESKPMIVCALVSVKLFLTASVSMAGGDFALGKIVAFSNDSGTYLFRFVQTDGNRDLLNGCRTFNVKVHYERVSWFSWLPFVQSGHPTKQQTKIAASLLHAANQSGQTVLQFESSG